jgi:LacI family transcriptional regulator
MTAILAETDVLAFAAMRAAGERGLEVPRDLSVVGFDDIPQAAAATPALTTVKNFRAEFEAHVREGRCTLPADWRASRMPVGAH